jgi:hypothetical protein
MGSIGRGRSRSRLTNDWIVPEVFDGLKEN